MTGVTERARCDTQHEPMRTVLRYLALCSLPLVGGAGAGAGFTQMQGDCVALVGPLLVSKCHARQLQYRHRFELAGVALGVVVAAGVGAWLQRRRASDGTLEG